jgi:hypothetical protein
VLEAFTPSSLPNIRPVINRLKSSSTKKHIGQLHAVGDERDTARPFNSSADSPNTKRNLVVRNYIDTNAEFESKPASETILEESDEHLTKSENQESALHGVTSQLYKLTGTFDETRLAFPEIGSGEVSRVFR